MTFLGSLKINWELQSVHSWQCCLLPLQLYREEVDEDCLSGNTVTDQGEEWVRLTRLYQFARNIRALLHTYHYNQIFLTEFQGAYNKFTGCSLDPHCYGYANTDELLSAIPQVGIIRVDNFILVALVLNTMSVPVWKDWSSTTITKLLYGSYAALVVSRYILSDLFWGMSSGGLDQRTWAQEDYCFEERHER